LPIPAVDGGRILFLLIEKLKKKPLNRRTEEIVNQVCFYSIIILSVFVTAKDINLFLIKRSF